MSTMKTQAERKISKVVRVGFGPNGSVFCKIGYANGKLSISGVEGPMSSGNCHGACGQIESHDWNISKYAEGWNSEIENRFREVWRKWHLNDMRAGCEHQREQKWNERPIYPDQPTSAYVKHPDGGSGWNMLVWLPVEHGGLLSAPCGVCGYRYGTKWLHEEVPGDVLDFFDSLPETDQWPAWV